MKQKLRALHLNIIISYTLRQFKFLSDQEIDFIYFVENLLMIRNFTSNCI